MDGNDDNTLAGILTRLEVQDLLEAYAWTIDHGDWQGWIELFVPDGVFSVGGREYVGREAVLAVAQRTYAGLAYMRRHMTFPGIAIDADGDVTARTYFQLIGATTTGKEVLGSGEYQFRLVREVGWRIARCDAVMDHYAKLRLPDGWGPAAAAQTSEEAR